MKFATTLQFVGALFVQHVRLSLDVIMSVDGRLISIARTMLRFLPSPNAISSSSVVSASSVSTHGGMSFMGILLSTTILKTVGKTEQRICQASALSRAGQGTFSQHLFWLEPGKY